MGLDNNCCLWRAHTLGCQRQRLELQTQPNISIHPYIFEWIERFNPPELRPFVEIPLHTAKDLWTWYVNSLRTTYFPFVCIYCFTLPSCNDWIVTKTLVVGHSLFPWRWWVVRKIIATVGDCYSEMPKTLNLHLMERYIAPHTIPAFFRS